jgi:hypothetical protein
MFDIIFMSYQEPNADENWDKLVNKYKWAQRVHGVKGLVNAHIECAKVSRTSMYYHVEADNIVDDKFNFTFRPSKWDRDTVHVWRAKNRVNDLVYGYSGIKLFPTQKVLDLQGKKVTDFTTSVSDKFKPVQVVASEVAYDTDPFNTWKAAFRECVKLQSGIIDRQKQKETSERLDVWCSVGNGNMGAYSIEGARAGKDYAVKNKDNKEALSLINDFEWLQEQFNGI